MGEKHRSFRAVFYLALLLLPREDLGFGHKLFDVYAPVFLTSDGILDTAKMYWHFRMARGQDSNHQETLREIVLNW